jgi:hypothetical protein
MFINQELEKTYRLVSQWPKKHKHANGGAEVALMPGDWDKLTFAYVQTDAFCTMESRHCHCGSTLAVMTEIHNLSEE